MKEEDGEGVAGGAAARRLGLDGEVDDALEALVADGELPEAEGVDGRVERAHGLEPLAQGAHRAGIARFGWVTAERRGEAGGALLGVLAAEDELLRGFGFLWAVGAWQALAVVDLGDEVRVDWQLRGPWVQWV